MTQSRYVFPYLLLATALVLLLTPVGFNRSRGVAPEANVVESLQPDFGGTSNCRIRQILRGVVAFANIDTLAGSELSEPIDPSRSIVSLSPVVPGVIENSSTSHTNHQALVEELTEDSIVIRIPSWSPISNQPRFVAYEIVEHR